MLLLLLNLGFGASGTASVATPQPETVLGHRAGVIAPNAAHRMGPIQSGDGHRAGVIAPSAAHRMGPIQSGYHPATTYAASVIEDGAVAHWRFNDPQANDGSFPLTEVIGGLNGLAPSSAGITPQQPGALDESDTAARLSGAATTLYFVPDAPALHITERISFEQWFKITTGTTGTGQNLMASVSNGVNIFVKFNASQITGQLNIGGATVQCFFNAGALGPGHAPALDVYHYLALTYDGAMLTLWLDAVPVGQTPATGAVDMSITGLKFGSDRNSGSRFIGYLDDAALFSHALSAEQIARRYAFRLAALSAGGRGGPIGRGMGGRAF